MRGKAAQVWQETRQRCRGHCMRRGFMRSSGVRHAHSLRYRVSHVVGVVGVVRGVRIRSRVTLLAATCENQEAERDRKKTKSKKECFFHCSFELKWLTLFTKLLQYTKLFERRAESPVRINNFTILVREFNETRG